MPENISSLAPFPCFLVSQTFFLQPMRFESCAQFEEQVIGVTHTNHQLSADTLEKVRSAFNAHMTPEGAVFDIPIRVGLLKKTIL